MYFPVSGIDCHPLVPVLAAMGISFVTSMGGLSGAFLLLPFQMSFLGYTSPGVSATNHLFNVLACPGGIVRYAREGRLLWPLALTVAVGTLPGIVLGSLIRVYWLPDESRFKVFAGLLLLWIFWRMFRDRAGPPRPPARGRHGPDPRGTLGPFPSGLHVRRDAPFRQLPAPGRPQSGHRPGGRHLRHRRRRHPFPPSWSASSACPSMPSPGPCCWAPSWPPLAGVLGYGFLGLFSSLDGIGADPLLGLLLGLGGLMGSYLGARCQRFVPARRIKWGLALILLFTSLRYLWQGL